MIWSHPLSRGENNQIGSDVKAVGWIPVTLRSVTLDQAVGVRIPVPQPAPNQWGKMLSC